MRKGEGGEGWSTGETEEGMGNEMEKWREQLENGDRAEMGQRFLV